MPGWKFHVVFGLIFIFVVVLLDRLYLHFLPFFDLRFFLLYIPLIGFSTLLPDIDHRISMPHLIVAVLCIIIIIYSAVMGNMIYVIAFSVLLLLIFVMNYIPGFSHRQHVHSILFIFLVSLLVIFISWQLAIIFFIGAFSHLLADKCIKIW